MFEGDETKAFPPDATRFYIVNDTFDSDFDRIVSLKGWDFYTSFVILPSQKLFT